MLMARVGGSGSCEPRACDVPGRGVAHRVAAAAHAELSGHGRQRQHRRRGASAVAIALEAPSALHQRRRGVGVGPANVRSVSAGTPLTSAARSNVHGSAFSRSFSAPVVCAARKFSSARPSVEQIAMNRQRDREVRARPYLKEQVGLSRERRGARIDHDELGAALAGLLQIRHDVNARVARIDAPQHD